jgi:nitric oxide dioxygenase
VRVKPSESEYFLNRQYSLSQAPGKDTLRISVKRETGDVDGTVSNYLHDFININHELEITVPAGDFTLREESNKAIYFLAGGVGITPLLSMFQYLHNGTTSQKIDFIQATINGSTQGFKEEITTLANNNPNTTVSFIYEKPTGDDKTQKEYVAEGYVSKELLHKIGISNDGEYYVCGPAPFMKAVLTILIELGVSQENIHYEFFGPAIDLTTYSSEVVH